MSGEIQLIYGPMFSGKSTELLRRIRRYTAAQKNCIALKYHLDSRYEVDEAAISTHDRTRWRAYKCRLLFDMLDQVHGCDVIAIDEGQFFTDIVPFAEKMANKGKIVIIAALDGTFKREAFGRIVDLLPLAEKVCKLSAICVYCKQDAAFSRRIGNEMEVELIGGNEKYEAVCRACFFNHDSK